MEQHKYSKRHYVTLLSLALIIPLLSSCWAVAVKTFGAVFGQQLISVAAHNYSQDYGDQVEELLLTLASETKKSWNKEENNEQQAHNNQGGSQQGYDNQEYNQQGYDNQHYSQQGYDNQDYAQQGYDNQEYNQTSYNEPVANQQSLSQQNYEQAPLSLDVAVLAQRSSTGANSPPAPINDGDTLYSIPGNPEAGDKIKLSFKANTECYIYIVGIDATGYVASIFPDPSGNLTNPVTQNRTYLVPGGTEWYGLDDYKGIEEIYFIASYNRRLDLERIIKKLSEQERTVPANHKNVQVAAVIPQTRGLVKIKTGASTTVQSSFGQTHSFKPTTFIANSKNTDLMITRWFNHN